jgi:hypothetical protein
MCSKTIRQPTRSLMIPPVNTLVFVLMSRLGLTPLRADRPAQQTPVAVVPNWMQQENFLACLEANVREYTQSLRTLLQKLKTSLHETTALSVQYMKVYKTTVDNVNDAVNQNAIVMHQLITKTQQLNEDLKQLQFLAQQIKNVKKDLSAFEKLVENLTKR